MLIAGASLAAFASPAMAMTFYWSFDDSAHGQPDQFVTGTISGLSEGVNNAWNLTVTIDSAPGNEMLGPFSYVDAIGTLTVTDGQITDAAASFGTDNDQTDITLATAGHSPYRPEFLSFSRPSFDDFILHWDYLSTGETQFSRVEDQTPTPAPEPAIWAMMVGGFGLTGAAMRRRRSVAVRFG